MDNFNQAMVSQLIVVASIIWTFMEGAVKPFIKQFVDSIVQTRFEKSINPELYPFLFKGLAWTLGIGAVLSYRELSFMGVGGLTPNTELMEIADIVSTGYVISMGERGVHSAVDLLKAWSDKINPLKETNLNVD